MFFGSEAGKPGQDRPPGNGEGDEEAQTHIGPLIMSPVVTAPNPICAWFRTFVVSVPQRIRKRGSANQFFLRKDGPEAFRVRRGRSPGPRTSHSPEPRAGPSSGGSSCCPSISSIRCLSLLFLRSLETSIPPNKTPTEAENKPFTIR